MPLTTTNFNNLILLSDYNGTGWWRALAPIETLWSKNNTIPTSNQTNVKINNSVITFFPDNAAIYHDLNSIMVQRLITPGQLAQLKELKQRFLSKYGVRLIYNIDDAMHYKDIPAYNRGRPSFVGDDVQERIKQILHLCDFILTTTDTIKEYYSKTYNFPLDNIITLPNLLPRWWIDNKYSLDKKCKNFKANIHKPRLGIISSASHYNTMHALEDLSGIPVSTQQLTNNITIYQNENGQLLKPEETRVIQDDIDEILDTIISTVDDFTWVFLGYVPEKLKQYVKTNQIKYYPPSNILTYPDKVNNLDLTAIVAPLRDNTFNKCKSNIKFLEAAALGIPLFARNIITYNKYVPREFLFDDGDELKKKLFKLKTLSASKYGNIIENQYAWLNSPTVEAGCELKNWWLEDNLCLWQQLFSMRKPTPIVSLNQFAKHQH